MNRAAIVLGVVLVGLTCVAPHATAQQKYAVLVSADEASIDDQVINSEFWYDLFLMYRMLIEHGFTHDNIFVLFGDGNDFLSAHAEYQTMPVLGVASITDYSNEKANVENIFTWLGAGNAAEGIPQVQDDDFLFYWWMGHGSGCACADYEAKIHFGTRTEWVSDNEFVTYFAHLPACVIKPMFVMTCRSGGLIDDFTGLHNTLHTAAECCTDAYPLFGKDVIHAEYNYYLINAFRQQEPDGTAVASDTDGDGLISVLEANTYTHTNTAGSDTQIADYRFIAPLIQIASADPDQIVPRAGVYSRDFAEDSGTEPSDYMTQIWWEGPDLWVRRINDGLTEPQSVAFGQPNYVYARIHNIGCQTLDPVYVKLSWCEQTAWATPAAWNPITAPPGLTVHQFEPSETRVVVETWNSVPAPSTYCIHTVLEAPGDPSNAEGHACMDNNKVQINVAVENTYASWTKNFHWLIENGLQNGAMVDVIVDKINVPRAADLIVRIPGGLDFQRVTGAEVRNVRDGQVIKLDEGKRRAILHNVRLGPRQKVEAVLSVRMPPQMKLGDMITVKISERFKGDEVGGVVFHARSASKEKVMSQLLDRLANVSRMLSRRFKLEGAEQLTKLIVQVRDTGRFEDTPPLLKMLGELTQAQSKITAGLSKLMPEPDLRRFEEALEASRKALEQEDLGGFVEWQEELIFATKPLFLRRE